MSEKPPEKFSSSSREKESAPSGFQVEIEKQDLIHKALKDGVSGEIGALLLENPIERVSVKGFGKGETFNLEAKIELSFEARHEKPLREPEVTKKIIERYEKRRERGGNYIIETPSGTEFIIGRGSVGLGQIMVTTGTVKDIVDEMQAIPAPQLEEETFNRVIRDFTFVLEQAVEDIYRQGNKTSPNEVMVLHPPIEKAGFGLSGLKELFEKTETPEQLIGKLEIERPNVSFEDIGGLLEAKREIQGLSFALKNPELYRKWGTKPPKGVILFGSPGTGKTLLARALASQAEAQFFHVEASDIASKWYGESEKVVKTIFEVANKVEGKTIIFFDEIDAIAPQRTGSHEATQRVVSTLLENMDGLVSNDNVMVVASTNRLDSIEPALLRAGRFDRWVEAPLPDEEGRKQIFSIHMKKAEEIAQKELFNDVNLDVLVSRTQKLSGADVAEIIRRALEEKVRQEGMGNHVELVVTQDITNQLEGYEKIRKTRKQIGFVPAEEGE